MRDCRHAIVRLSDTFRFWLMSNFGIVSGMDGSRYCCGYGSADSDGNSPGCKPRNDEFCRGNGRRVRRERSVQLCDADSSKPSSGSSGNGNTGSPVGWWGRVIQFMFGWLLKLLHLN